jgi:hypothetical protein
VVPIGFAARVLFWPALVAAEPASPSPARSLPEPCVAMLVTSAVPARVESTLWIGGGGSALVVAGRDTQWRWHVRAGAGLSFGLASSLGGGSTGGVRHVSYDLRWGPWLGAETNFDRHLGEGGLELLVTPNLPNDWVTYSLRAGGAFARDDRGVARQVSLTFAGGLRSVPARFAAGGVCDRTWEDPKLHAYAHGARIFITARFSPPGIDDRGLALLAGLEIDPLLLVPKYTRRKWIPTYPY